MACTDTERRTGSWFKLFNRLVNFKTKNQVEHNTKIIFDVGLFGNEIKSVYIYVVPVGLKVIIIWVKRLRISWLAKCRGQGLSFWGLKIFVSNGWIAARGGERGTGAGTFMSVWVLPFGISWFVPENVSTVTRGEPISLGNGKLELQWTRGVYCSMEASANTMWEKVVPVFFEKM